MNLLLALFLKRSRQTQHRSQLDVGYVFIGILFLCVVLCRHSKIPNSSTDVYNLTRSESFRQSGIPMHYGVFYATGIALTIKGLISADYHICRFLYVMAVLCMIKLSRTTTRTSTPPPTRFSQPWGWRSF
jgi:hypothetical protein